MKRMTKLCSICVLLLSLISSLLVSVYATEDTPVDYAALFAKAETVDGHSAETYFYEMNQLFDSDPEAFVVALSKENLSTNNRQAFHLAYEHQTCGIEAYEEKLNQIGQKHKDNKNVSDTLFVLRMNILYTYSQPNIVNPNHFQENHFKSVQQYFEENSKLFLLVLSDIYHASERQQFAKAMVYGQDKTALEKLDDQLVACSSADWANEDTCAVITLFRSRIDIALNPIDYTQLFDKEATMDDGQIEGYYYEISQLFDKDPASFISALTQRPFAQIYSIANALAWEHNNVLADYDKTLISVGRDFRNDAAEKDTIYVLRLVKHCFRIRMTSDDTADKNLINYFESNHKFFLKTMAQMSNDQQAQFMGCILEDRPYDELKAMDAELSKNYSADWATEAVKPVIEMYRTAIGEIITPAGTPDPAPPTEPSPTEPAPTEATTAVTTAPTSEKAVPAEDSSDVKWLIPVLAISAVLIIVILLVIFRKKTK